jgi:hypothetical protein
MAITTKQIADHFGFTPSRASALIREGMPLTSIEDATAWRDARILRGRQGRRVEPSNIVLPDGSITADTDFDETVNRHRELKEAARQRYIVARDTGLNEESKLYQTYQHILKTLVVVEREALARKLDSKELIKTIYALEILGKILLEIKSDLLVIGMELAPLANPDSPGTALKVIDDKINKLLAKWSQAAADDMATMQQPVSNVAADNNLADFDTNEPVSGK